MIPIPIFGTQTANSLTNIKRLIDSIDYPIHTISIVVNNKNIEMFHEVEKYAKNNSFIQNVSVSFHPTNLGTPASWNYHFKTHPQSEYFIKVDDDIELGKGNLEQIINSLLNGDELVFASPIFSYAFFGIKKSALKKIGLFDENLYPCNYEDDDYEIRQKKLGIKVKTLNLSFTHTSSGTSRNLQKNEHAEKMVPYIKITKEYFDKKWSGEFGDPMSWNYNFNYRENKKLEFDYYT